jgi:hypothetical protein
VRWLDACLVSTAVPLAQGCCLLEAIGAAAVGSARLACWMLALMSTKTVSGTISSGASLSVLIASMTASQRSGVATSPRSSAAPSACLAASAYSSVRKANSMAICPRA